MRDWNRTLYENKGPEGRRSRKHENNSQGKTQEQDFSIGNHSYLPLLKQ